MTDFPEECAGIQKIALELGYDLTIDEVDRLWHRYSDQDWAAGFMGIYSRDMVREAIARHLVTDV